MPIRVLHLIGDALPGGSNRLVQHWIHSALGSQFDCWMLPLAEAMPRLKDLRPDLIISHYPCSWFYLRQLLVYKQICPVWIYEHHYCQGFVQHQVRSTARFYPMLRLAYGLVDRVIAVSEGQRQWMLHHQLVNPAKVEVITPASPMIDLLALPPKPQGVPLVIGAYGRFAPQKGFDQLLEAFAGLAADRFQLRLGGYGPEQDQVQQRVATLKQVTLVGHIEDVPRFLRDCDVVAIPSRWEPWGLVCLEAKMAGKPLIAAAVDGLVEQVQGCGLLVAEGDRWRAALSSLPEQPLAAWGQVGRESVTGAWPDFLGQWQRLIAGSIPEHGGVVGTLPRNIRRRSTN